MVKTMTPFTFQEFERIWDEIAVEFCASLTGGRGPKSTTTPKDIFFMTLSVLKDPTTWDKIGTNFSMSGQKAHRIVTHAMKVLAPLLKKAYVRDIRKDAFEYSGIRDCANYPYVHHITDASILAINRPVGSHSESKPYFSGEFCY